MKSLPGKGLLQAVVRCVWLLPHLVALMLLPLLGARLASNLRFLRRASRLARVPMARVPRVSILIPARNEAATISKCVTSLLNQEYLDLEVIVLDDGSTDGTSQQLDALARVYPNLKVLHEDDDPPAGWTGKSYACHRLAEHATGEWLLFTDADTLHASTSIAQGITLATRLDVALLSVFPYQRIGTWSERILVSFILDFLPLIGADLEAMWRGQGNQVVANGQYLLAHATHYWQVGGHITIRSALVDDFALARRFRACGYAVALVDGTDMLSCRMYRSFHEVWEGFSKNLLGALSLSAQSRRPPWQALLFAWCYACLFVSPFFNLAFGKRKTLAGIEILGLYLLRALVARRLKRAWDETLATPLAAWSVMAIGMGTLYQRWRQRPVVWKGRRY